MYELNKTGKVFSVLELNNTVRDILDSEFADLIWVCGEIQDIRIPKKRQKKHIYFNLVQKHPEIDQVIAQISAALFENNLPRIQKRLQSKDLSQALRNDIEVKLLCRVNFYPKQGRCNLIVYDIDTVYTLGKIAQSRQLILKRLRQKGLLNKNKEKAIPEVPLSIGLLTAYNSAAFFDFMSKLKNSGIGFKICLINCHMQGVKTEQDITRGLKKLNSTAGLDLIAITRGGGSTSDLGWFDSEKIAEAVALSRYPVLSAIGHEINISVLELTSKQYFKTPTELAGFLVETVREFLDELDNLYQKIILKSESILNSNAQDLEKTASRIQRLVHQLFSVHKETLARKKTLLHTLPPANLKKQSEMLSNISKTISQEAKTNLILQKNNLHALREKVNILNPRNVLKRGFSITQKNGRALKSLREIKPGEQIQTTIYKGKFRSIVEG